MSCLYYLILNVLIYGRNAKTSTYLWVSASKSSAMNICTLLVFGFTLQILCVVNCKKNKNRSALKACMFTAQHSGIICLKEDGPVAPERSSTLTPAVDGFSRKQAASSSEMM